MSRHLRVKLLPDDDADLARLKAPTGLSFFLTPVVPTPRGVGCPDDAACRQLIADETKTALLDDDADRCAVVNNSNVVIDIIKADPALDAVPGSTLLLHRQAVPGDTWNGTQFLRRFAIAAFSTGVVTSISTVVVGTTVASNATQFAIPSSTAQIGNILPIAKRAGVTAA